MTKSRRKDRTKLEPIEGIPSGQQPTIQQAETEFDTLTRPQAEKLAAGESQTEPSLEWATYFGVESPNDLFSLSKVDERGVFFASGQQSDLSGNTNDGTVIAPRFTVVGIGTSPGKGESALVLEFRDRRKKARRVVVPLPLIHQGGYHLTAFLDGHEFAAPVHKRAREVLQHLLVAVSRAEKLPRIKIVSNTGWVHGLSTLAFVTPQEIIGDVGDNRVVADTEAFANLKIARQGKLEEWRDGVAAKAAGNSRLQLALGTAFSSCLLHFAPNVGPTVAHIYGESSTGKSSAAVAAGSVWGGSEGDRLGFAHSWNATANFHIANATAHSGTLLALDEIHTAQDVVRTAYTLASGQGRGRLNKDAQQRSTDRYQTMVLSTGELTLDEMERQHAGQRRQAFAGAEIRLPSIPADAGKGMGLFEDIQEFAGKKGGAAGFADELQTAARSHYGHAGPRFVECVIAEVNEIGEEEFRKRVATMIREFAGNVELDDDADDAVKRLLRTFGLIAVAGRLACRWKILPLDEDEFAKGIATCFEAWIKARGGARSKTSSTALVELRDYLQRNAGRFVSVNGDDPPRSGEIAGYSEVKKDGSKVFYILPSVWKSEIIAKAPRANLIGELDNLDLLIRQGKSDTAQYVKKIDGQGVRTYAVSGRILELTDEGTISGVHDVPMKAGSNVVTMGVSKKHVMDQLRVHSRAN